MAKRTSADRSQLKTVDWLSGCLGVVGLNFSCGMSICGLGFYATTFVGRLDSNVPIGAYDSLMARLGYPVLFALSIGLPFVLSLVIAHITIIESYLPRGAWRWWAVATLIGGVAYLTTAATLYYTVFWHDVSTLRNLFFDTEGSLAQLGVVMQLGGLGAVIGGLSASALVSPQWLVLRHYANSANRWAVAIVILNAIIIGILLVVFEWGAR
jgi:hypothetical protein